MKFCLACKEPYQSDRWECTHCHMSPLLKNDIPIFHPAYVSENDGYNPDIFDHMPYSEEPHYFNKARAFLILWIIKHFFANAANFLEIGCGKGTILSKIQEAHPSFTCWGSEIYLKGLEHIKKKLTNVHLFQTDARQLPFYEEFDIIGAFDVLEHIEEDVAVLKEMYKAVKPQGGIILSVPQYPQLWSQRDEFLYHKRRYTRTELVKKVRDAGFRICKVTSFNVLLFPLFLLIAMHNRYPKKNYNPFREFNIPRPLQKILTEIFALERFLIQLGIILPFGGSLLLVAKRN